MRILQLIDSLRPGGAERMAVNYANALARRGHESFLSSTRLEGLLKKKLDSGVIYLFLDKKHTMDSKALFRLRSFVKKNQIQIIHAHSSSFFLAVMIKMTVPGIKIIWHDHYGRELGERKVLVLKFLAKYFDGVISVNETLRSWAEEKLKAQNVVFIKNFLPDSMSYIDKKRMVKGESRLKGKHQTKIICVANLRPQKDHINLLKAFNIVLEEFKDTSLHLVGKDYENVYSQELKLFVENNELQKNVFLYGENGDVQELLQQAKIAVLSSASEGLPVALLEYGLAGLPVACTEVGEINKVLNGDGLLVPPKDPVRMAEALKKYLSDDELIQIHAKNFHQKILKNFTEAAVFPEILSFYSKLKKK